MALDQRFNFSSTVGVKVIIRSEDKILLTKEPLDHTWMPGRYGLPGGKTYLNEDVITCLKRKIDEETGCICEIKGLFKIIDILMPEKNVYFFVFVADIVSQTENTKDLYTDGLFWKSKEEILSLSKDDLAEYYYNDLFAEYYSNPNNIITLDKFNIQRSYQDAAVQEWQSKGTIRE